MLIHNHIISNMPRGKNVPSVPPPSYEEVELSFRVAAVADSISRVPAFTYWGTVDHLYFIGNSAGMTTALRWQLTGVPSGSIILDARITLWSVLLQGNSANAWTDIGAEQVDNASQLTNYADHGTRQSNIGDTIQYGPHSGIAADSPFTSPNLADIIQPIIDRGGWAGGNFIQFFSTPNPSTTVDYQYYSYYDGNATYYPRLVLNIERPL